MARGRAMHSHRTRAVCARSHNAPRLQTRASPRPDACAHRALTVPAKARGPGKGGKAGGKRVTLKQTSGAGGKAGGGAGTAADAAGGKPAANAGAAGAGTAGAAATAQPTNAAAGGASREVARAPGVRTRISVAGGVSSTQVNPRVSYRGARLHP
eukprot:6510636-Prymnesium_polylepis.1